MANYMTLLGAEDVRSAGNTMSHAADNMRSAASSIDESLNRHQMSFAETVQLFAASVAALGEIKGMEAANQHRLSLGHTIAYDDSAFFDVITKYGVVR